MKDAKKVAELLKALKAEADSTREMVAIERLEKELINEPPTVEIVDEEHQSFNGSVYKVQPSGHYKRVVSHSLHMEVYKIFFGEISEGCVIHHKDLNPANNNPDNLQLMTRNEHTKLHNDIDKQEFKCANCGKTIFRHDRNRAAMHFCNTYCKVRYYHKKDLYRLKKICSVCGKAFETYDKNAKFCSHTCDMQDRGGKISRA